MKAISLWQPWASLIVHGAKSIETRGYQTKVRGRIAIHSTKREDVSARGLIISDPDFVQFFRSIKVNGQTWSGHVYDALPRGCILGTVELYGCVPVESFRDILPAGLKFNISNQEYSFGNYEPGRFGWLLRDPILFDTPIPFKGAQGFWNWEPE